MSCKRVILVFSASLALCALSGCASLAATRPTSPDWAELFASYGAGRGAFEIAGEGETAKADGTEESERARRKATQDLFASNAPETARMIERAMLSRDSPREELAGAADAAVYLAEGGFLTASCADETARCLAAIESRLLRETDWFIRFACANAIDSIDSPTSEGTVVRALEAETGGMPAMMLASYLARRPAAGTEALLSRKYREFSAKGDGESRVACAFIDEAILALRKKAEK